MANIIAIIIIVICLGLASSYIYKQKKCGNKCIGCANAKKCPRCHC